MTPSPFAKRVRAGTCWSISSPATERTLTITATDFPAFPKENIRARCNNQKVRGVQVNYKSAEKYVGDDTLDLLVLFPGGFGREVHLNINVR